MTNSHAWQQWQLPWHPGGRLMASKILVARTRACKTTQQMAPQATWCRFCEALGACLRPRLVHLSL